MPPRKNQHFVPRHVLRPWTEDERVQSLHLDSGRVFTEHVSNVCARNYFYGSPPLEAEIGDLEGLHARPINELRNGSTLPDLDDRQRELLLSFVTTQRTRTKAAQEDIEDGGGDFLREGIREDLENGRYERIIEWNSDLTEQEKTDALLDASVKGIHHREIVQGIFGFIGIGDLHGLMLRNATAGEFLISDTPVVHDNPRYKTQRGMVRAGLANRGLQIYCPIDPDRILLLYDPLVYEFDTNSRDELFVKSTELLDELNLLQFHSANDIVMSRSADEHYLQHLSDEVENVRRREPITDAETTESGRTLDLQYEPRNQLPKLTPELPSCRTRTHVAFEKRRATARVEPQRELVASIFRETRGASDVAVVYAIRLLQEMLDL